MAGGIQIGTTASSPSSKILDKQLKDLSLKLAKRYPGYHPGHSKHCMIFEGVETGCVPDGGVWFDDDRKVRVAFEAKYQGDHGNAHERQSKNYLICDSFKGKTFKYITFMSGLGARPNGVLDKFAKTMLKCRNSEGNRDLNVLNPEGLSFFMSVEGFTDEQIQSIMEQALV